MTRTPSDITRAAERYLEQYGDPLVMNTYLKVTILVLAGIVILLGTLIYPVLDSMECFARRDNGAL